jgi:hypothetical protein
MKEKKPKLEHSDFSGEFTLDGATVLVDIFRKAGSTDGWTLEVINPDDLVTVWDEPFASDQEAYEEFLATVEKDGIDSFSDDEDDAEPEPTLQ